MKKRSKSLLIASIISMLGTACQHPIRNLDHDNPPPRVYIPQPKTVNSADASIYGHIATGQATLFDEPTAHAPGDLLTVILGEDISASNKSGLSTSRNSATTALTPKTVAALGTKGGFGKYLFQSDQDPAKSVIGTTGTGDANIEGTLTGSLTAVITDVMPNGQLVIRGYKRMGLTQGSNVIRITGLVRTVDIQPDNTILSRRIADADIKYVSTGELADATNSGWLNKLLYKIWPF